ncbi:MAG: carboxypeptidase-like regulatory domain-containing protein [Planctomycetota bacterium]|nr:carboxypeptidase-like regulatory domain-containing protein [Planctomycetota bacterium]
MIALAFFLALSSSREEPRFRVFDARDKSPIAGATLELWTEEGEKPLGAMTRIAVLHSGADGTGEFSWSIDGIRPSNVRVFKAGYASHSVTLNDLEEGVELYPAAPLAGRVVDLDGKPVARAVVRSRETCAHAVSAAETWTDADGRFVLGDCPADDQQAELEVLPREHVPLASLEIDTLRRLQARDGSFDLHVARRPPIRATVLDERGQPLVGCRIAYSAEPYCAGWSDQSGLVILCPPPQGYASLSWLSGAETRFFPVGYVPDSGVWRVRLAAPANPEHTGKLRLDFGAGSDASSRPRVLVVDSKGTNRDDFEFADLATGPATVVVGQSFSPWVEEIYDVAVSSVAQSIVSTPKPAPAVDIRLPEGAGWSTVMVQAGSAGFRADLEGKSEHRMHVPPGVELVFVAMAGDGEVRRVRHPAITAGVVPIDMRGPEALVSAGSPRPPEPEPR